MNLVEFLNTGIITYKSKLSSQS